MKRILYAILLVLLLFASCKKEDEQNINNNPNEQTNDATYTVTFEKIDGYDEDFEPISAKNGETVSIVLPDDKIIESSDYTINDDEIVLNHEATQFAFLCWEDASGKEYGNSLKLTKDITLHLNYKKVERKQTITLHLNGGNIEEESLKELDYTNLFIPSPVKDNSTFIGWYLEDLYLHKVENFNNLSSTQQLYALFSIDIDYLNSQINELNDEITFDDIDKIDYLFNEYKKLPNSSKLKVENVDKLINLNNQLSAYVDARNIYNDINNLPEDDKILASDRAVCAKINLRYEKLPSEKEKNLITNFEVLRDKFLIAEAKYQDAYKNTEAYRQNLSKIQIGTEYINKNLIISLEEQVKNFNENDKSIINSDKLDILKDNLNKIEQQEYIYVLNNQLNQGIYTSREELFKAFFTDFYYFMVLNLNDPMADYEIYDLDTFLSIASNYDYGRGQMRAIGDIAGDYFLKRDVNGVIENQPDNVFLGFCYKNNMYKDFIPFFIRFFAYWRLDEKYASLDNYGADTFAEAWAPTVDLGKFFYYNVDTSYVQTERMRDCFNNTACVVYGFDGTFTNSLLLRDYEFAGWYDNPECTGTALTSPTSKVMYAKWNVKTAQLEKDQAELVEVYIYNLTTTKANVNATTISYARNLYNNLSENSKTLVSNYNKLLELEGKYGE